MRRRGSNLSSILLLAGNRPWNPHLRTEFSVLMRMKLIRKLHFIRVISRTQWWKTCQLLATRTPKLPPRMLLANLHRPDWCKPLASSTRLAFLERGLTEASTLNIRHLISPIWEATQGYQSRNNQKMDNGPILAMVSGSISTECQSERWEDRPRTEEPLAHKRDQLKYLGKVWKLSATKISMIWFQKIQNSWRFLHK